jgi:hypothetical protein
VWTRSKEIFFDSTGAANSIPVLISACSIARDQIDTGRVAVYCMGENLEVNYSFHLAHRFSLPISLGGFGCC